MTHELAQAFRLDGKRALITGGATGIGLAIAESLAGAGAGIAILARDAERAQRAADELHEKFNVPTYAIKGDVSDDQNIEEAVARIEQEFGELDILIANSGVGYWSPALDVEQQPGWRDVLGVNLDGVWNTNRAVGRRMVERGRGAILNIGSISAQIVNRPQWQPAYNASKAAVHQLTKSLAAEWAPHGIRVNALAPGFTGTDILFGHLDDPAYQRYWIDDTPLQRPAEPAEMGPPALFLVSDASSYITGTVLVADGGYTLW